MATFIRCTQGDDSVLINIEQIAYVEVNGKDETEIGLFGDCAFVVDEDAIDVIDTLKKTSMILPVGEA